MCKIGIAVVKVVCTQLLIKGILSYTLALHKRYERTSVTINH